MLKVLVLKISVLIFFGTKSVTTISSEGGRQACVAQSSRPLFGASCVYQCTHISNGGYWLVLSLEMLCAGGACCIARPWDPMDKVCVWHRPSLHPASNLNWNYNSCFALACVPWMPWFIFLDRGTRCICFRTRRLDHIFVFFLTWFPFCPYRPSLHQPFNNSRI